MNDQITGQITGQCLCGDVAYQVEGKLRPVVHCYCSQCRRTHGVMGPYTQAQNVDITFTAESGLKWYQSSDQAERGFCNTCGSSLFWKPIGGDYTSISAGTLDQPTGLSVSGHIYVGDLPDFHVLPDDGTARFAGTSSGDLDGDLSS
ncbi:MAG: GFA family protein [Rhodospirillales bacterium]|jgi:hypothetical protein|nr:GFA family protein [Rhodospirillales bacterium]MBT4040282.1 GFA family protein [Rhodospirillales bacterium]MBT4626842.1 GFA family protein [Rhodospirillales bacterium]MBT5353341.1 GFA family protein [Rhodospirillales bacterium]MBT5519601.1 GFA family protein [Rhodospirillales bacterium]